MPEAKYLNKKLHVAICFTFANNVGGGVSRSTFDLVKTFHSFGYKVTIIYKLGEPCNIKGVSSYKIPFPRVPFFNSLYYSLKLSAVVNIIKPDLVITQCNTAPLLGKLHTKHAHIIHNLQLPESMYADWTLGYIGELPIMLFLEITNILRADKVLAVNKELKNSIESLYKVSPAVIKWSVNKNIFYPLKKQKNIIPQLITVISGNTRRKNLQNLIRACGEMNVKLNITNCPYKNLPKNVYNLGYISDETLASELQKADLFVLPSSQESFGISTLEALACNTPVLISKTGIWQEVTNYDAGIILNNNTVAEIKKSIEIGINRSFGNNPTRLAATYDWTNTVNTIMGSI